MNDKDNDVSKKRGFDDAIGCGGGKHSDDDENLKSPPTKLQIPKNVSPNMSELEKEYVSRLVKDWNFDADLAKQFARNGLAEHLLRLEDEGFNIAEEENVSRNMSRLVEDWNFNADLAKQFARNGLAEDLFRLEDEGFKISEDDPLLLINIDINDADSRGYFNRGNYGIQVGTPGYLAGPIPAFAQQTPALGRFIGSLADVEDKSAGNFTLFYVPTLERLLAIPGAVQAEPVFIRRGNLLAAALGVPVEDSLVNFYILTKMNSAPGPYPGFNRSF